MSDDETIMTGQGNEVPAERGSAAASADADDVALRYDADEESKSRRDDDEDGENNEENSGLSDMALPEEINPDDPRLGTFQSQAAEMGLSRSQAEEILDLYTKDYRERVTAANETQRSEITQDPVFGGNRLQASIGAANQVLARFGDNGLLGELDAGLGNSPGLFRLLNRMSKAMSDDTLVTGNGARVRRKDAAETLYPNKE